MQWVLAISKGIGYGIFLGILSIGPTFFALIQMGMQGGKSAGLRMALGVFLSDLTVALACFFGLSKIFVTPQFQLGFSAFAAFGILFIGVRGVVVQYRRFLINLRKPVNNKTNFLRGFIVNLLNPFVLLLWVGILGAITVGHDVNDNEYLILVQMMSILATVFALDIAKVHLSDFIGQKLNFKSFFKISKYIGYALISIGIYYLYHFFKLLNPLINA
jgi:threonine/homoserine/homoserine lactone efflux protein